MNMSSRTLRSILKPSTPPDQLPDTSSSNSACYPLTRREHVSVDETAKARAEFEVYMDTLIRELFTSEFMELELQDLKQYYECRTKRSLVWKEGLILSEHEAWSKEEYDRRSTPDYVRVPCAEYEYDDYIDEYAGVAVRPSIVYTATDVLYNPPPIFMMPLRRTKSTVFPSMGGI